ncbi:MAG: putative zinc-binding protein [Actinobacteria bacterium]|nr:putative zinc-binding protein [Actinomycetota bacterium]
MRYVKRELALPPKRAVVACEGACIKGEVARVAANILAYRLQRDAAVRICSGDASTGNSGMLDLVTRAPEVIAIEGCRETMYSPLSENMTTMVKRRPIRAVLRSLIRDAPRRTAQTAYKATVNTIFHLQ